MRDQQSRSGSITIVAGGEMCGRSRIVNARHRSYRSRGRDPWIGIIDERVGGKEIKYFEFSTQRHVTIGRRQLPLIFYRSTLSNHRRATSRRHCTIVTAAAAVAANVIVIAVATVATAENGSLTYWFYSGMRQCIHAQRDSLLKWVFTPEKKGCSPQKKKILWKNSFECSFEGKIF